jgi:hypothetical protein
LPLDQSETETSVALCTGDPGGDDNVSIVEELSKP